MADPAAAGGGMEGLRDDLAEWLLHRFDLRRWQADAHAASLLERGPLAGPLARASAEQARVEAENARLRGNEVVSARLTAWQEGHGGVDITLANGRRIALALDAPHLSAEPDIRAAREARLGPGAHLGRLPDLVFRDMLDGAPHRVSDLCRAQSHATRKQVYNAVAYLLRRGQVVQIRAGLYRAIPRDALVSAALNPPKAPDAP